MEKRLGSGVGYPEGLFYRAGDEPLDASQLKGRFPRLPQELLAAEKPALALLASPSTEVSPARLIPPRE